MEGTREGSSQTPRRTGARLGHARRVAVSPSPRLVANSFGGEGTQSQAAGEWPGGCGWSRILGDQELIRFLQTLRELGRPFCSLGCPVDSAGMLLANPSPLQIWVPGLQRDPGQLPRDTASPQPASRWTQVAGRHPWPTRAYLDRPGKEAAACPGPGGRMASKHADLRAGSSRAFPRQTLSLLCLGHPYTPDFPQPCPSPAAGGRAPATAHPDPPWHSEGKPGLNRL